MSLIEMSDLNAQKAVHVCKIIRYNGKEAWLVGGCVRDALMGRAPHDFDIATNSTTDQIMRWFPKVIPTGIKHGTVTIVDGEHSYEVTTYRGESGYSDGRRPDLTYSVHTIEEDLSRRDFSMNAIAYDPIGDKFCDPYGGAADIILKRIRCVGSPIARFAEDGLRCLRACRFAATLGFTIDAETKAAIIENVDVYKRVSVERVVDEWRKAFKAPCPAVAFRLMIETGLFCATVPEFTDSIGCAQNRYHAYTVDEHVMAVLESYRGDDLAVQLGCLFHDIAKPITAGINDKTGERTFYNHEEVGADMTKEIMTRLKFPTELVEKVSTLVRHHLIPREIGSSASVRRWVRRVGTENVDQILALAQADLDGKGPALENIPTDAVIRFRNQIEKVGEVAPIVSKSSQLAINGSDVMRVLDCKPGKQVGDMLAMCLEHVTEHPKKNTREDLLDFIGAHE